MNFDIQKIVKTYLKYFENEFNNLEPLFKLIKQSEKENKNILGHIKESGFIYDKKEKKILLLEHKKLGKLLQPGGHVEKFDTTILDTAKREIYEETGLENLDLINFSSNKSIPFDINIHPIPANLKINMPAHYHHDFRYLFTIDSIPNVKIDSSESNGYKWVSLSDLQKIDDFKLIIEKINKLLNI